VIRTLTYRSKRHSAVGLALGVTTALAVMLFAIVRRATDGPPAIDSAQTLLVIGERAGSDDAASLVSIPDFAELRTSARSTEQIVASAAVLASVSADHVTAEDAPVSLVTSDYFRVVTGQSLVLQPGTAAVSQSWVTHAARAIGRTLGSK
jgi:hypothetical protein